MLIVFRNMSTPIETSKLKLIHKVNNKRQKQTAHTFSYFSWNLKLTNLIFFPPLGKWTLYDNQTEIRFYLILQPSLFDAACFIIESCTGTQHRQWPCMLMPLRSRRRLSRSFPQLKAKCILLSEVGAGEGKPYEFYMCAYIKNESTCQISIFFIS